MKRSSSTAIDRLLQDIEMQLAWGESEHWSNKDFVELSEQILTKTGSNVSVTTLKRAWGRANHTSSLSQATLDILAQFGGYENWRAYGQQHQEEKEEGLPLPSKSKRYRTVGIIGLLLLIPLAFLIFSQASVSNAATQLLTEEDMETVQFDFTKVTVGYPNTVLFRYDLGNIPYDTLELQQSWDTNRRMLLDSAAGLVTSTYYHPGYYLAKLVRNNQIIRQKNLYIPTDGWQARIDGNVTRLSYLQEEQLFRDSMLRFQEEVLTEMNTHPYAHLYLSHLSNEPRIKGDRLVFASEFRLAQPTEQSICKEMAVIITGTKEVLLFQFSIPGCVGELMLALGGEMVFGDHNDLSAFGIDPKLWVDFRVTTEGQHLEAFIADQKVFDYRLPADIGLIGGVTFKFAGLGEVRSVTISDGTRTEKL